MDTLTAQRTQHLKKVKNEMNEWRENSNGNYVYVIGSDQVMTVFQRRDGNWAGVYQNEFTKGAWETPEEVMRVMEPILGGDTSMLKPTQTGWVPNKDGKGFHLRQGGRIASAKLSSSGSWYLTVDGDLLKGQWFKTASMAMKEADRILNNRIPNSEYKVL